MSDDRRAMHSKSWKMTTEKPQSPLKARENNDICLLFTLSQSFGYSHTYNINNTELDTLALTKWAFSEFFVHAHIPFSFPNEF